MEGRPAADGIFELVACASPPQIAAVGTVNLEVLLDGRPLSQIPRAVRADSLALVDQDIFLIEGSVRELLTMWDATVAEQDMVQAAQDAGLASSCHVQGGMGAWKTAGGSVIH